MFWIKKLVFNRILFTQLQEKGRLSENDYRGWYIRLLKFRTWNFELKISNLNDRRVPFVISVVHEVIFEPYCQFLGAMEAIHLHVYHLNIEFNSRTISRAPIAKKEFWPYAIFRIRMTLILRSEIKCLRSFLIHFRSASGQLPVKNAAKCNQFFQIQMWVLISFGVPSDVVMLK